MSKAPRKRNVGKVSKTTPVTAEKTVDVQENTPKVSEKEVKETKTETKVETKKAEPKKVAAEETESKKVVAAEEETKVEAPKKKRGRPAGSKNKTAKKTTAEKPKTTKAELSEEVYLEFGLYDQVLTKEIVDKVKEAYCSEGHRVQSIKSLKIYVNLEQRRAYYVINGKAEGKSVPV